MQRVVRYEIRQDLKIVLGYLLNDTNMALTPLGIWNLRGEQKRRDEAGKCNIALLA